MNTPIKPLVAIVGRPNVGKSRLFNRLIRRMRSIVADTPGVTRDRIYAEAELSGVEADREIVLVDTGGFDPTSEDPIIRRVLEQTQLAIDEADVVIFLADGRAGLMGEDADIAKMLRKSGKPVVVGVNKIDGPQQENLLHEFYKLGIQNVFPVSAAHGRGVGELEEAVVEVLPDLEGVAEAIEEPPEAGEDPSASKGAVRVAVIGRPNVGKSSIVNRLMGEDRHLVSEIAGTTVDSVDSLVEFRGEEFLFVDTAGIRRKRSIAMRVERFSVIAALKGMERSDVALLLLDATQPVAHQDAKVASFAQERGKAVIIVVSKWDLEQKTTQKAYTEKLRGELAHLAYAPVIFTSSHTGYGLERLMSTISKVHREYARRVTTSKLNKFVEELMLRNPPPTRKKLVARLYYITQVDVRPPRFLVSVNKPERIHFSYRRFLVNELRDRYGFTGVPLLVGYRSHKKDEGHRKPAERGKAKAERNPKKQATAIRRANKQGKKLSKKWGSKKTQS